MSRAGMTHSVTKGKTHDWLAAHTGHDIVYRVYEKHLAEKMLGADGNWHTVDSEVVQAYGTARFFCHDCDEYSHIIGNASRAEVKVSFTRAVAK